MGRFGQKGKGTLTTVVFGPNSEGDAFSFEMRIAKQSSSIPKQAARRCNCSSIQTLR